MRRIVMLGNIGNLYAGLAMKRVEPLARLKFEGVKIDPVNGLETGSIQCAERIPTAY